MQNIDWQIVSRIAAPIIAAMLVIVVTRLLDRPRVVTYLIHATGVVINPPAGQPIQVNTHSIVVHNTGRKPARNLRLGHFSLPAFSVYPPTTYTVSDLPGGGKEILFPTLVPKEQFTISYLYLPPLLWSQIHSYQKSDEGIARVLSMFPSPRPARWARVLDWALNIIGAMTVVYLGWIAVRHFR